ncbi:MAG: molybdate ABC transporter substrate-binding protein [Rhodospirillales bacterium]|nr:MAG: molybdate ABC transporter substrate-binding protein [Rhodospirillales bacterium]
MAVLSRSLVLALAISLSALPAKAGEALVAVAVNFTAAANEIATAFAEASGHTVRLAFAPTGVLYTQITQGAPFEVYLAADRERPEMAEREGFAVPGSRFTYAIGTLVLWSADPRLVDDDATVLTEGRFRRLAIVNPVVAPYGAAAMQVLDSLGLVEALQPKIVQGSNIAQAYQFVATGNAEIGFVALAQVVLDERGSFWIVPDHLHEPIRQDAVLLKRGADNPAAVAFHEFLQSPTATEIIRRYGYAIPDPS